MELSQERGGGNYESPNTDLGIFADGPAILTLVKHIIPRLRRKQKHTQSQIAEHQDQLQAKKYKEGKTEATTIACLL